MSIFYPVSLGFIKNNAKQLKRIYPDLSLYRCQEAVACAMGFKSWFDASKRIGTPNSPPAKPDENLARKVVLQRRYQQSMALINEANLPASEVDFLVRKWNMTAKIPSELARFEPSFKKASRIFEADKNGNTSKVDIDEGEPPKVIAEGIIFAKSGDVIYYHLSQKRLDAMPLYLRGNSSLFLEHETGHHVVLAFPELFSKKAVKEAEYYLADSNIWLYEMHKGSLPTGYKSHSIKKMVEEANEYPNDWFALSVRHSNENIEGDFVIPALTGKEFVEYVKAKGSLRGLNVQWFKIHDANVFYNLKLLHYNQKEFGCVWTNRLPTKSIEATEPIYGTPFKFGPFDEREFEECESSLVMLDNEVFEGDEDDGYVYEIMDNLIYPS